VNILLLRHVFAFLFSFLLGVYLIPILIRAAKKIGFFDNPDSNLKRHREPMPYLGGLGVFIPFITTLGLCYPFENHIMWLLFGTTLLLFIGLIDDIKVLQPFQKFFGQFLAVLCFLKGGFSLKTSFFSSLPHIFAVTFWMLTVINAFNLVDIMDGLCVTLALVAAASFFVLSLCAGSYSTSLLLASFIGSLLAFFWYNKPSAKIYLGDSGSLFIGGFLSTMPLFFSWDRFAHIQTNWWSDWTLQLCEFFLIPSMILAIPLLEVISLFTIRTYLGIPFYYGSPHHFAIYLKEKSWSTWDVLRFVSIISLLFSTLAGLFVYRVLSPVNFVIGSIFTLALWFYVVFIKLSS